MFEMRCQFSFVRGDHTCENCVNRKYLFFKMETENKIPFKMFREQGWDHLAPQGPHPQ